MCPGTWREGRFLTGHFLGRGWRSPGFPRWPSISGRELPPPTAAAGRSFPGSPDAGAFGYCPASALARPANRAAGPAASPPGARHHGAAAHPPSCAYLTPCPVRQARQASAEPRIWPSPSPGSPRARGFLCQLFTFAMRTFPAPTTRPALSTPSFPAAGKHGRGPGNKTSKRDPGRVGGQFGAGLQRAVCT